MLKTFRKEGVQKKILWVLAAVIIISFVFFGTMSTQLNRDPSSVAGRVFGKKVSITDFQKHYNNTRDQAIMIHGENFFKMSSFLNLEAETWDRIVLLEEARRRRITVKDTEIIDLIGTLKMFQRNGEFDDLLYKDLLRFIFKRAPRDFEEGMREQLKIMKLFEQVTSSMSITEKEIREAYRRDNEKIQVSYALLPPSDFMGGITVNEAEAKSYYESNNQDFMTAPSLNIQYISLEYPPEPKEEDKNSVKDKAYEITSRLQSGDRLETLAKEYNLEIKESGFFSMNQPNMALGWSYDTLEKIFDLKVGETSEPIESPKGYQFLSVKERQESTLPDFESVKSKAIETVKTNKALEVAGQKANEYAQKIREAMTAVPGNSFYTAVESLGLKVQQTPVFNRGQYLPVIGLSKEFQDAAYDLTEKDKLSSAVRTAKGYCILYRDAVFPFEEAAFQQDRDKYSSELINEKRNQMIIDFISEIRMRADVQNNLDSNKKP